MSDKSKLVFENVALKGTGKKGVIKPDEDGYYPVNIAAFDVRNEAGHFYKFNSYLKNLFTPGSGFMRQLLNGNLRMEANHPVYQNGWDDNQWFNRLRNTDMTRLAAHLRRFELKSFTSDSGEKGQLLTAWVKPYPNEHGNTLKASLENPNEDTCFSMRTIALWNPITRIKNIIEFCTVDWVPEPGLRPCRKYKSAALEGYESDSLSDPLEVTPALLDKADMSQSQAALNGMESSDVHLDTDHIRKAMGWEQHTPRLKSSSW